MKHTIDVRQYGNLTLLICLGLSTLALLLWPEASADAVKKGLSLCGNVILPSLFPFFVLSSMLVDLGISHYLGRILSPLTTLLFRVNGSCSCALALGFIGGYPLGARTAIQLYQDGQCTKTQAERLLAFCNNCSPAFVFGVVGIGIFGDSRIGLILYLVHLSASFLVGFLFRFYRPEHSPKALSRPDTSFHTVRFSSVFPKAVTSGLQSSLNICAFVLFFSVIVRMLSVSGIMAVLSGVLAALFLPLGLSSEAAHQLLTGLLEISSGIASLTNSSFSQRLILAAFMLGWSGLSVHCQVLSFLNNSGLSIQTYLIGNLLHGFFSVLLVCILLQCGFLDFSTFTFSSQMQPVAAADLQHSLAVSSAIAWIIWLLFLLLTVFAIKKSSGKMRRYGL